MLWFIIYWYISKISVNISGLYIRRYILYVRYTALHVPFYQLFKYKSIKTHILTIQVPFGQLFYDFFWDLGQSFWFTGINLQGNVHIFLLIFTNFYCDHWYFHFTVITVGTVFYWYFHFTVITVIYLLQLILLILIFPT